MHSSHQDLRSSLDWHAKPCVIAFWRSPRAGEYNHRECCSDQIATSSCCIAVGALPSVTNKHDSMMTSQAMPHFVLP